MSDLDSFFAKKDKKKLKGKKFTTTDEIAQRLVDTEKKTEKTIQASSSKFTAVSEPIKKPEEAPVAPTPEQPTPEVEKTPNPPVVAPVAEPAPVEPKVEDDQWNDFKDDDTVDVSNLRITKLNIEEEEDGRGGIDGNEDCRDSSGEDKKDGVWKIEEQKSVQASIDEQVEAVLDNGMEDVKARVAAMSGNTRWTSSIQRDMQPSLLPRGSQPGGVRRKKVAPDITNAAAFPTLADAKASGSRRKAQDEREGGEVRGGGGSGTSSGGSGGSGARNLLAAREASSGSSGGAYRPPQLRTNNRFGALSDHGSLRHQS